MKFHVYINPLVPPFNDHTLDKFSGFLRRWCDAMIENGYSLLIYGFKELRIPDAEILPVMSLDDFPKGFDFNNGDWLMSEQMPQYRDLNKKIVDIYVGRCKKYFEDHAESGDVSITFYIPNIHECLPPIKGIFHVNGMVMGAEKCRLPPYNVYCSQTFFNLTNAHKFTEPYTGRDAKEPVSVIIPPWVNEDEFVYQPIRPSKLTVLFLGRLHDWKGFDLVVELARFDLSIDWIIAGSPAPKFDLPVNCRYVGYVGGEKRKQLLGSVSVLIQPSRYNEPFGFTILEALLSGTPVVVSNRGTFKETVTSTVGRRVSPDSSLAVWREAIDEAVQLNREDCYQRGLELNNRDRSIDLYLEFFRDIGVDI